MSGGPTPDELRRTVDHVRAALAGGATGPLVVVGDVMLDRYVDGSSTRLSPEAPVPVIDVTDELERLGGAANVAVGLAALGAEVVLVGVVGDDDAGERVESMLADVPGIETRLVVDATRLTTVKERVRVDGRHVIRIDREDRRDVDDAIERALRDATQQALAGAGVLVVSDYAKGAVAPGLVAALTDRPITVVDPKHADVERYRGADVLAPNRAEAIAAATAADAPHPPELADAIGALHARLPGTALVVTCGADGIVWSGPEEADLSRIPSLAHHVADVTGAGDSVVCGLAAALATGTDLIGAIALASAIAAAAVAQRGTAAPTWDQVKAAATTWTG